VTPTAFRNVDVDEDAPLATWPYEALVTLVERGGVVDWARLADAVFDDPWGPVARQLEEYLSYERPYGVAPLLERVVERARAEAAARERAAVAQEVDELVRRSGLPTGDLARRLGTSRTRLSTYRSGRVTPSAAFMVRLRRTVERLAATRPPA
jgi:DNA-binding transcriptional regulator YiaG